MNIKKTVILTAVLTILPYSILARPENTYANSGTREIIRVSPVIIPLTLSPNKETGDVLIVENLLDIPLPVKLSITELDIAKSDERDKMNTPVASLRNWVFLENTDYILAPKEKKRIPLFIRTPGKIPFGGYFGMIYVQPVFPGQKEYQSLLTTKIGVFLLGSIGTPTNGVHPAEIATFLFPQIHLGRGDMSYGFSVKSTSLYHFSARPFLHLLPIWGDGKKFAAEEKLVFPGNTRIWDTSIPTKNLAPGIYRAELRLSRGNGNQVIKTTYVVHLTEDGLIGFAAVAVIIGSLIFVKVWYKKKNLY